MPRAVTSRSCPRSRCPVMPRLRSPPIPTSRATPGPFEVWTRWGVDEDVFCPGEETFAFIDAVLGEVAAFFPGPYIHIGGDEVPKTRWRASPLAQEIMR